jgi:hypothetical protein
MRQNLLKRRNLGRTRSWLKWLSVLASAISIFFISGFTFYRLHLIINLLFFLLFLQQPIRVCTTTRDVVWTASPPQRQPTIQTCKTGRRRVICVRPLEHRDEEKRKKGERRGEEIKGKKESVLVHCCAHPGRLALT